MTGYGTTLAALVLSLLALPLVPAVAHAQTEEAQKKLELELKQLRIEAGKNEDANRAQAELQQAHAELAKLQAEIRRTQERIKMLEQQLAAMKDHKTEQPKKEVVEIILRRVGDHWEVVQQPAKPT